MPTAPTQHADRSAAGGRRAGLQAALAHLAAMERPSASGGEREAAHWIAERLRELGCRSEVEGAPAHGGYWWPLGLANALALVAAVSLVRGAGRRRRLVAGLASAVAARAVWDDVGGGRLWFRRLLPHRTTWNVVAETGDPDAERTLVFIAHHDAAHTGAIFNPRLPHLVAERFPEMHARASQTLPIMYAVWLGPVLVALAAATRSRRLLALGGAFAAGAAVAMADIGRSPVVPGANDNLSAVATLLALAQTLAEETPRGVRVLLVSTGSEESFMEGMHGFARRHFPRLDRSRTEMVCVECVGGPALTLVEGEGMLRMRAYDAALKAKIARAADAVGVEPLRGLQTVAATDALVGLRRGYRVATLASIDPATGFPANYHWPSDTPENLDWNTIEQAIAVCASLVRQSAV